METQPPCRSRAACAGDNSAAAGWLGNWLRSHPPSHPDTQPASQPASGAATGVLPRRWRRHLSRAGAMSSRGGRCARTTNSACSPARCRRRRGICSWPKCWLGRVAARLCPRHAGLQWRQLSTLRPAHRHPTAQRVHYLLEGVAKLRGHCTT